MKTLLLVVAGLVAVRSLVDRLLVRMEWKGWIDDRRTDPGRINPGHVGPAFLSIPGPLEPEKRHAADEQGALRTERDEEGAPPPLEEP